MKRYNIIDTIESTKEDPTKLNNSAVVPQRKPKTPNLPNAISLHDRDLMRRRSNFD